MTGDIGQDAIMAVKRAQYLDERKVFEWSIGTPQPTLIDACSNEELYGQLLGLMAGERRFLKFRDSHNRDLTSEQIPHSRTPIDVVVGADGRFAYTIGPEKP